MQSLPLEIKIIKTQQRIREWYEAWGGNVAVSFSGGKDSTVLLKLVREIYPDVEAVFIDTGLEYPEIKSFVGATENVTSVRPSMSFNKVIEHYGFPVISKSQAMAIRKLTTQNLSKKYRNKLLRGDELGTAGKLSEKWKPLLDAPFKVSEMCCDVMKKRPIKKFSKETGLKFFTGEMAEEQFNRQNVYLRTGCNAFDLRQPKSMPLGFWTEKNIWDYLKMFNVRYSSIYDMGERRTGCMWCMFGVHLEKGENRFQRMAKTHPKQYDYCINKLGLGEVLDYIGVDYRVNDLFEGGAV